MSEALKSKWIIVAKVGRAHGIKGYVYLHSFTEPRENILSYAPLFIKKNADWEPIHLSDTKTQSGKLIVRFQGVTERNMAEALTGYEIAISQAQLPQLDEGYYWEDLIQLNVINLQGVHLGKVTSLLETGSNDVLVVKRPGKTQLIPFLEEDVIKRVDINNQQITVDWDKDF